MKKKLKPSEYHRIEDILRGVRASLYVAYEQYVGVSAEGLTVQTMWDKLYETKAEAMK